MPNMPNVFHPKSIENMQARVVMQPSVAHSIYQNAPLLNTWTGGWNQVIFEEASATMGTIF
jgi:hypothetical protein